VVVSETPKCFWIKVSDGGVVWKDKGNVILIVDVTRLLKVEKEAEKDKECFLGKLVQQMKSLEEEVVALWAEVAALIISTYDKKESSINSKKESK
jgi:hypothetical protein